MRDQAAVGVDPFFDVGQIAAIDDPVQPLAPPTSIPDLLRASASVTSSQEDWVSGWP